MSFYGDMQGIAAGILAEFKQGVIQLTRNVEADPEPETPYEPGALTETVFTLDATAKGVSAKYVDGTLILASDLMVVSSVMAMNGTSQATEAIEPSLTDILTIDGTPHRIKRIDATPASGTPVVYTLFVEA